MALPANATYDEADHTIRAYAVASGQIYADDDQALVPRSLLPDHVDCAWTRGAPTSAACQQSVSDSSLARTPTTAARYSPVYYLPVGLPLLTSPDQTGIILARLVSGLLSGMLMASAFAIAAWLGNRLLLAGLALAATPMTVNLAGAINPNGLEIAAGVLLWVALLTLLRARRVADDRATRGLVLLAAVSAGLLITVRQLGPVLLAVSVGACVLLARRGSVRALLRRADTWWIGAPLVGGAVGFALVWTLTSQVTDPAPTPATANPMPLAEAFRGIAAIRLPFYEKQLIGQFSYGETGLPPWLRGLWWMMIFALVVPVALRATRRYRVVNVALFGGLFALLAALELRFLPHSGWFSHSRYVMPAGVGLLLLPGFAPRRSRLRRAARPLPRLLRGGRLLTTPAAVSWFARLATLLAGAAQLAALALVASRFQSGPSAPVNPFVGDWLPPTGPAAPLLATLLGMTLLAGLTWRLSPTTVVAAGTLGASRPGDAGTPTRTEQTACGGASTGTMTRS